MAPANCVDLRVERSGVVLAGSLWSPGPAPRSVVLMHPGSGPSDRDNDVLFPPIRAAFLEAGHAVASFDKRGVGGSTGTQRTGGIEQQAADMRCCLEHLRDRHPDTKVGVFGHSQGGWVVYETLGSSDLADFGIANSGPAVSPAAQERHALERATTGNPDQRRALELFDELVRLAGNRATLEEVHSAVEVDVAGSLSGFAADLLRSDESWELASLILSYDPAPAWQHITVPLMAVFGADDPIVPVEVSVDVLRSRVAADLLTVAVFAGAGHRIEISEEGVFAGGYLEALVSFVRDASVE